MKAFKFIKKHICMTLKRMTTQIMFFHILLYYYDRFFYFIFWFLFCRLAIIPLIITSSSTLLKILINNELPNTLKFILLLITLFEIASLLFTIIRLLYPSFGYTFQTFPYQIYHL